MVPKMNDFINTITNIRTLRSVCKDLSIKELRSALEKLTEIVDEREEEENRKNEENRKKIEAISNIRAIMAEAGIKATDIQNLISDNNISPPQKRNVPPKYRFTTADGQIQTWTGQGRTPLEFINCIKREGKRKEDYLIKDKNL